MKHIFEDENEPKRQHFPYFYTLHDKSVSEKKNVILCQCVMALKI